MHKLSIILLYLILCICSCSSVKENNKLYEEGVSKQLAILRKENIHNPQYHLHFNIPECRDSIITGRMTLSFDIKRQQEIVIDFRDVEKITSVSINGNDAKYRLLNEHIIINAEETKEGTNNIDIAFAAGNQSLNRNEEFLYTLLVPDRARTVFPCFDQPDMKASYHLTLTVPEAWTAVSNSSVHSQEIAEGRKTIKFKKTEPLSTYLFSFVAGLFEKQTYSNGRHTLTAYHRETDKKRIAQLPEIFKQVTASLAWMEEYTGVEYPFGKYDFIILPGFQYGGMEHTGATLYNDSKMFLGEKPTIDEELARASLIAHETAHMWFGDYVTMRWFDDVWTKEVFANYFASRITEPMFPHINHRLNWLKNITSAALSEDRTQGGTSIRQPLDNMNNAGLIYNNIIYDKAPIMLEKLIELMGEEAFRAGIKEYLQTYAYGNASWDELINILDRQCEQDLKTFSHVWVNSNGMPTIDFTLSTDTLSIKQSDTRKRGLTWAQNFNIQIAYDSILESSIVMSDAVSTLPLQGKPYYILPNSDGRGYGYFRYNKASLLWALNNWHTIDDETCRQSQLMNLHEAYQHNEIKADLWLTSLTNGLAHEQNPLIASTVCSYISMPLMESADNLTEKKLYALAQTHPLTSCRQQLLRSLIAYASDSTICINLYDIWDKAAHPLLNENDYMNMAYELAIHYPHLQKQIIARQAERISNPDRKRQFEYISRATTPDTAEQRKLFKHLLKAENRRIEPWALKTLGYLCHRTREQQAATYIAEAIDSLQYIQRTSDIFFPQSWTRTLLADRKSQEATHALNTSLQRHDDYNQLLKNKILQAAWNLQRRTVTH